MQTKLVKVGNSFGEGLPKASENQYNLENSKLEKVASVEDVLLKPTSNVPSLSEWGDLFKKARQQGFNANEDLKDFEDWDNTLQDGEESS
jgi:hypothetical protein